MRGKKNPHLYDLLTHGDVPEVREGLDDADHGFSCDSREGYTEDNSVFICLHLFYDPTVEVHKYVFRGKDGSEIWNGDLLCHNCMEKDIYELASEGVLVLMSHDELMDVKMKGMDT